MTTTTTRRSFLKGSAALSGALVIGFTSEGKLSAASSETFMPNPFVKITPDNKVIVIAKHFEMGQGTTTGLPTLIAEELEADWQTVEVAFAPADPPTYKNLLFGAQGTGGSSAIANSFEQYRKAGAAAKELLIEAAAKEWGVPEAEITAKKSMLTHASGKKASFGEMVANAAKLELLGEPTLKDPKDFTLIGKQVLPRKDSTDKTNGTATFAIDVKVPDMVYVVIARSPRFGGTVKSVQDSAARAVNGVVDVKQVPRGIAVYAKNTWAAIKGRNALEIEWDFSKAENRSSDEMFQEYTSKLDEPGNIARNDGDAADGWSRAEKSISATFSFPFLAHAPMEPLNCVLKYDEKGAELWDGCQFPSMAQPTIAAILGLKPEQVKINTVYAGGSFGRRANPTSDYHAEAAMTAKAIDGKWPVKLIWTREDDLKGGYYRPMFVEKIEAGIDKNGTPVAWQHRLVGKSIAKGTPLEAGMVKDGVDKTSVEGGSTLPYAIPNLQVDVHNMETPIPVLWWRSVGHTHTAYSTEIAIDMLAKEAGKDPVEFRLALLEKHPRHAGVLKLAAEKAGWSEDLPKSKGRGIAVHESFNSFVAQVVEVSANDDGAIKIERVVCAVDCGVAVNPDVITAQMEGGIGYALSAAMGNEITFSKGEVEQDNFPDYEPLRINAMPKIEVHILPSAQKPTGVGEPGVPPCAPALANAIHDLTGKRIFQQPFSKADIEFA